MDGLVVERLKLEHVYDFLEWGIHGDPLFAMYNFEEEKEGIEDWYRWKTKGKNDRYFALVKENYALGYMGLKKINPVLGSASLGIILDANYMGMGLGREGLKWILAYGFTQLKLKKVDLEVLPWNFRAGALYKSFGFMEKSKAWRRLDLDPFIIQSQAMDPYREKLLKWAGQYYIQVDQMVLMKNTWRCEIEI